MLRLVGLFALVGVICAQHNNWWDLNSFVCRSIDHQDCASYSKHNECGTDGVTYVNRCFYNKAHCKDHHIHIAHVGACGTQTHHSTDDPVTTGTEAQQHFFCNNLMDEHCTTDKNYVCGSDGHTYDNVCEFEKAKCMHSDLKFASDGRCHS